MGRVPAHVSSLVRSPGTYIHTSHTIPYHTIPSLVYIYARHGEPYLGIYPQGPFLSAFRARQSQYLRPYIPSVGGRTGLGVAREIPTDAAYL